MSTRAAPDYVQLRDKLDRYSEGLANFDAVISGECDAEAFTPQVVILLRAGSAAEPAPGFSA